MIQHVNLFLTTNFQKKSFDTNFAATPGLQVSVIEPRKLSLLLNYVIVSIWPEIKLRLVNAREGELIE